MGTIYIRLLIGILAFCSTPCFAQSSNQAFYNNRPRLAQAQPVMRAQVPTNARYSGAVQRTGQAAPPDPHFAIQAQNARERLRVEEAIARERYALLQEQYRMPFPRQLPQRGANAYSRNPRNQYSMYRRQDDPFGENQVPKSNTPKSQDPFGEDQPSSQNPPVPSEQNPPKLPPQQFPPKKLPPANKVPPQQTPAQGTPPKQSPPQQAPNQQAPVVPEKQPSQQTTEQPIAEPTQPNDFQPAQPQNRPIANPPTDFQSQPKPGIDRTVNPFPDPPRIEPNPTPFQAEQRSVPPAGRQQQPPVEQQQQAPVPQIIPPQQSPPIQQPENPVQNPERTMQPPIQRPNLPGAQDGSQTPGRDRMTAPETNNVRPIDPGYPPGAVIPGEADRTQNNLQPRNVPPSSRIQRNPQFNPGTVPPTNLVVPAPGATPSYQRAVPYPGIRQPGLNDAQPNYAMPYGSNQPYIHPQQGSAETTPFYQGVACTDCDSQTPVHRRQNQYREEDNCYCPAFYVGVFGGVSNLYSLGSENDLTVLTSDGGGVGFAVGQIHGCNLRSELEFTFRTNEIAGLDPTPTVFGTTELDGYISSYSGMANFYWEFMRFPTRRLKPYVGGGLGFVSVDSRLETINGLNVFPNETIKDSSYAYQLMTGLNFEARRSLDIYVEYRYFKADAFRVDAIPNWGGGEFDYESSNVFAGARFKF